MGDLFTIPQGEKKIAVELTIKEAMALMGQQFPYGSEVKAAAQQKVRQAVERQYEIVSN
ncbi:hypothetical protein NQ117_09415 [Paenibacillus sp. SC116]|uniref:Uncharacterized protein n=1 Tax=Paenibacillus arenosi TaxID=2774142 RepID=A0ABR9AXH0_9BACL|nr:MULTISPECIES: hypothetical protein [Paenibacillus]MBD8498834.1 hypothetical protein [Paenibacillus arenosi]MCR8843905.1 hypothetical protein [Paenibacillus sp. SC116]